MKHILVLAIGSCLALFAAELAQARGMGGAHSGNDKSGGGRSEGRQGGNEGRSGGSGQSRESSGGNREGGGKGGGYGGGNADKGNRQQSSPSSKGSNDGAAASRTGRNNNNLQASGAQGAAAGAAAKGNRNPDASGAQGAAAGAAAANRNAPTASGAQGATAGAAAANRNQPAYSGAQGAAAGAAATNRNNPQYSGAQGAAAGAAVANRNQPAYSGAQGAAAGAIAAGGFQSGNVGLPTDAGYGLASAGAGIAAATNHRTMPLNGGALVASGAAVRNSYGDVGAFNQGWYGGHPGAWTAAGWTAARAWSPTAWVAVVPALGIASNVQPVAYDYGDNITYQGDQVYYGNQPQATAQEYYQQAATIAQSAPPTDSQSSDWSPLGVFALVKSDKDSPHYVMQLAVNNSGALAGNYCDLRTDTVHPIHGSVDKNTQRVAWMVGDNASTVGEVGLVNLTHDETPVLIHVGPDKTQQWMLVRLQQPQQ